MMTWLFGTRSVAGTSVFICELFATAVYFVTEPEAALHPTLPVPVPFMLTAVTRMPSPREAQVGFPAISHDGYIAFGPMLKMAVMSAAVIVLLRATRYPIEDARLLNRRSTLSASVTSTPPIQRSTSTGRIKENSTAAMPES